MKNIPKISIIVPIYKVEKYLENCVHSIINQDYPNKEIILVDDGSPDNCPLICDRLAEKFEDVVAIHKENGGVSSARNLGIEKASGEYVCFFDSDDTMIEKTLSDMVKLAQKDDADMVIPILLHKVFEETGKRILVNRYFDEDCISDPVLFAKNSMINKGRWSLHGYLYNADIIRKNKILFSEDQKYGEDFIFNLEYIKYSTKIAFFKKSTMNYLVRKDSATGTFSPKLFDDYMSMDVCVSDFFEKTSSTSKEDKQKQNQLLCRNILHYITTIVKFDISKKEKKEKIRALFKNDRITEAFNSDVFAPVFTSKSSTLLTAGILKLIKANKLNYIYYVASFARKINNIIKG